MICDLQVCIKGIENKRKKKKIDLLDLDPGELFLEGGLQIWCQWSSCGHHSLEIEQAEIELMDDRILNQSQNDRWHDRSEMHLVFDQCIHEGPQIKPSHHNHLPFVPDRGAADASDSIDVEKGHQAQYGDLAHHIWAHSKEGGAKVGHYVSVGQHHTLGCPSGTG